MSIPKFYYRFKAIAIDYSDEREIKKYNRELLSFDELLPQFDKLKSVFDSESKEHVSITVNILPDISGITELSVCHILKRRLFSKTIRKQCFLLCITKYISNDETGIYFYETVNIEEVERIFRNLVENQTPPDVGGWKYTHIG